MNILLINPFHTGSHANWVNGLVKYLPEIRNDHLTSWTLPGKHWKWRMHGAGGHFAERARSVDWVPDLVITTDMMDVASFRGLLPAHWRKIPIVQYFHENQLTFPWSPNDPELKTGRNRTYEFMNIQSAAAADSIWFNSAYHRDVFIAAASSFLKGMPDHTAAYSPKKIHAKSRIVPLGIRDKPSPEQRRTMNRPPVILWNHRWEYDKGPDAFFDKLNLLIQSGENFQLILCGEQFNAIPEAFQRIQDSHGARVIHSGFAESQAQYGELLRQSDLLIHLPLQEYFGLSVAEAMSSGVIPLLQRDQAYPEWVPDEFLFDSDEEFLAKWRAALKRPSALRLRAHAAVQPFFWSKVAIQFIDECRMVTPHAH